MGNESVEPANDRLTFDAAPNASDGADRRSVLTKREREILRLLADGLRNEQIGRQLSISPLTVRTHVRNAMTKLGTRTRCHAVAEALRRSLIS